MGLGVVAASLLALTLLVGGPTSALAAGSEATGLRTGMGHTVRVLRRAAIGIEAGMPRDGSYGKALELDRRAKYYKAYRMFRQAEREFRALQRKRSFDKRISEWIAKASQQRSISYNLNRYVRYTSRYRSRYSRYAYRRFYQRFNFANNCHRKWLAIRAFGLEPPRKLAMLAIKAYQDALKQRSRYRSSSYQTKVAWLQLGGLYAELGQYGEARRAFGKVSGFRYTNTKQAAAYYHAVLGQRGRAMDLLRKAIGRSTWRRRQVNRSNFFDSLRGDPRFEALISGKR
jgi:hypothetical protein